MKYIYLYGSDGVGWSIDSDRYYTKHLLKKAGFSITHNPFLADAFHFVWWNQIEKLRYLLQLFPGKKVVATITNNIEPGNLLFNTLRPLVDCWVAANRKQQQKLQNEGVNCVYQPFYVDEQQFVPVNLSRKRLCDLLGIDHGRVRERLIIGSFQRDSLGADLTQPKWQKGPELLVELLIDIKHSAIPWLLLLAGPRRHWIISQCEKYDLPYIFYGAHPQTNIDDIFTNNLSAVEMNLLYNLADMYMVTSALEGGPKGLLEATYCNTAVMSTDVGWAADLLVKNAIYTELESGKVLLKKLMSDDVFRLDLAGQNRHKALSVNSRDIAAQRWTSIYDSLQDRK